MSGYEQKYAGNQQQRAKTESDRGKSAVRAGCLMFEFEATNALSGAGINEARIEPAPQ